MIKTMGLVLDVLQRHGKIIMFSVFMLIVLAWNAPPVRDSVLDVIGIGTHTQQMRTAEKVDSLGREQKEIKYATDSMMETLKDMRVFQLQSIITNEALPLELRISAYDEYTGLGYNSWVHIYYEKEIESLTRDVMNYRFERLRGGQRQ